MIKIKIRILISLIIFSLGIGSAQVVTTIAGPNSGINDALIVDSVGNIYGSDFGQSSVGASAVYKLDTAGVLSTFSTGYSSANGLAFDQEGALYVVDFTTNSARHQIYKLDENGTKSAYGPPVNGASGIIFDPLSDTLYISQYTGSANWIYKLSPDGNLTLHSDHEDLNGPVGMAFDTSHVLYVANFNDGKIFRVNANGGELTLLADIPNQSFWGVGFLTYAAGYLYATGIGTHRIYQISLTGDVVEWAGTGVPGRTDGHVSEAQFSRPNGIATNKNQDKLYVSDLNTSTVREINLDAITSTDEVMISSLGTVGVSPNPANDLITLKYHLLESSIIHLQLYSNSGHLIEQLFSGKQASGHHLLNIPTNELPAGMYYCKIISREETQLVQFAIHH